MPRIDPEVIRAATEGALSVRDAEALIQAVLDVFSDRDASRLITTISQRYGHTAVRISGIKESIRDAPVRSEQVDEAQQVLLAEGNALLGPNWLLPWQEAEQSLGVERPSSKWSGTLQREHQSGRVLAFVVNLQFELPVFQFEPGGALRRAAGSVNEILDAARHPLAVGSWWLSRDGRIGSRRPYQLLDEPDREPHLIDLARASLDLVA